MSQLILEKTKIVEVLPHPNADRLSIYKVYGWLVIGGKDQFKVGDEVIYLPVDSLLSEELETRVFGPDSKIKLHNHRIKSIKIRGELSQGLILDARDYDLDFVKNNVKKYEPTENEKPATMRIAKPSKKIKEFYDYDFVEHGKYYDRIIQDNEPVMISTKIHGTNARHGWFKRKPKNLFEKALNYLGLLPEWIFAWGSHRVQIQSKLIKKHQGFKSEAQGCDFGDVYTKMIGQYNLKNKIPKGFAIYSEICGSGIQKNYMYGCKSGEHKMFVFDVLDTINNRWLNAFEMLDFCEKYEFETVPVMYTGPYSNEVRDKYLVINPISDEVNEGVVVKPLIERSTPSLKRVLLKWINPEYYLKNNSDFH